MRTYGDLANARILEVGSLNVNGSLRDAAAPGTQYVGLDFESGPSVDFVLKPGEDFPVDADSFDLVMASSVFEHDMRFWDTFLRMCRAAKAGGHIYVNTPSNGTVHRYPMDCWRFYPDAGLALAEYARANGMEIDLIESFIGNRHSDVWNDFVAVFRKGPSAEPLNTSFVYQRYPSLNARTWQSGAVYNASDNTEDMKLIDELRRQCDGLSGQTAELEQVRAALAFEQSQQSAFNEEIARLSAIIAQTEQASEEAAVTNTDMADELATLQSNLRQRQEEIAQAWAHADELATERNTLRDTLIDLQDAKVRLETKLSDSEGWVFELSGDRRALEDRLSTVQKDLERTKRSVAQLESVSGFASSELGKQRLANRQILAGLGRLKGLKPDPAQLHLQTEQLYRDWQGAENGAANADGEPHPLVTVAEMLHEMARSMLTLDQQNQKLQRRVEAFQHERSALQTDVERSSKDKLVYIDEIERLNQQKTDLHRDVEQLVKSLEDRKAAPASSENIENIGRDSGTHIDGIAFLEKQKGDLHASLEMMVESLDTQKTLTEKAEQRNADLSQAVETLRVEALQYHTKAAQAIEKVESLQAENKKQKGDLHASLEMMVESLDTQKMLTEKAEQRNADLSQAMESLRVEALQYHTKAAQAIEKVESLQAENKRQARALQASELHAAKRDQEITWLRKLYQLIDSCDDGWAGFMPRYFRKRRLDHLATQRELFDGAAYLNKYPDVAEAGMSPLRHYVLHGLAEGRHTDS